MGKCQQPSSNTHQRFPVYDNQKEPENEGTIDRWISIDTGKAEIRQSQDDQRRHGTAPGHDERVCRIRRRYHSCLWCHGNHAPRHHKPAQAIDCRMAASGSMGAKKKTGAPVVWSGYQNHGPPGK
ncbi:hypothetical protein DESC_580067 [Desulfosarcina cetonica]|nr:hypothetical protein DESC_580067 [Desulfosarcina cetonica]